MKISLATAQKLLEELGADVELVAENDDKDVDIASITSEVKATLKPTIESELKDTLEASIGARSNGSALSAIQQVFGIPKKELDGKTFKEMFGIVKEHTSSNGATEANEWKGKYEAAVQDYEAQLEQKHTEWETKYNADIENANKRYADRDINDAIVGIVNKMPRSGGDPVKQARVLRNLAQEAGYEMSFDEAKKALVLMKDGKPAKVDETFTELAADVLPLAKNTSHVSPNSLNNQQPVQRVENANYEGLPAGDKLANVMALVNKE
jgi:hypothetical protein